MPLIAMMHECSNPVVLSISPMPTVRDGNPAGTTAAWWAHICPPATQIKTDGYGSIATSPKCFITLPARALLVLAPCSNHETDSSIYAGL